MRVSTLLQAVFAVGQVIANVADTSLPHGHLSKARVHSNICECELS